MYKFQFSGEVLHLGSISMVCLLSFSFFGHLVLSRGMVTVDIVYDGNAEALDEAVLIQRKLFSPGGQVEQGHIILFQLVTGMPGAAP